MSLCYHEAVKELEKVVSLVRVREGSITILPNCPVCGATVEVRI